MGGFRSRGARPGVVPRSTERLHRVGVRRCVRQGLRSDRRRGNRRSSRGGRCGGGKCRIETTGCRSGRIRFVITTAARESECAPGGRYGALKQVTKQARRMPGLRSGAVGIRTPVPLQSASRFYARVRCFCSRPGTPPTAACVRAKAYEGSHSSSACQLGGTSPMFDGVRPYRA